MSKGTYDIFDHWHERGTIYFYSDPHFGDEEIYRVRCNKKRALKKLTLKEFDQFQIDSINKRVGKYDTIVLLGDIGDLECVKKIRGYKVLIMGNHDAGASNYKRIRHEDVPTCPMCKDTKNITIESKVEGHVFTCNTCKYTETYDTLKDLRKWLKTDDNRLFDEVYQGRLMISEDIVLSHAPYDDPYALNIHGHDHSGNSFNDPMHWNMCAEYIDYTPVPIKDVINSGRLKNVPSLTRDAIDKQIEDKKRRSKKGE